MKTLYAWGLQDLFMKMEGLEMIDATFTVKKVQNQEATPLSKFEITFDVLVENHESPIQYID